MKQNLVIIRGNSGSGKSTVAKKLQLKMGYQTMLIPLDVIRRDILRVADTFNNPSNDLISLIAMYGNKIGYDVIIEGILSKEKYGDMLNQVIHDFNGRVFVYYLDVSFEETLRRHQTKAKSLEFGEKEMREWWKEKDYLATEGEILVPETLSQDEIVDLIFENIS